MVTEWLGDLDLFREAGPAAKPLRPLAGAVALTIRKLKNVIMSQQKLHT